MIKYIEYNAYDENGQHITPVNTLYHMNKTASGTYSPEVMKVILNMKRRPDRYYVVINALGSSEVWGSNRNGDAFPIDGLSHVSLRTDMGTQNDYGYKTFEYYAVLFKHHVNKDPKKGFGEVVFSHWNQLTQRVELVVAVNTESGKDIVDALENGDNVAVSMGCKVRYDRCSICDNKAKTRPEYCKHLKNHMNEIVSRDTAEVWSKELRKTILPGAQVFAYNDHPRFFDISKVHIGADKTAFILGKAASEKLPSSIDMAEAYGITDDQIDKLSMVGKESEIDKEIGGSLGPTDIDGTVTKVKDTTVFRKALDEKVSKSIAAEPLIPKETLNSISALPLNTIFSTMLGMGIFPKPAEFQRIIIVKAGGKDIADELDDNNEVFDYKNCGQCNCNLDLSNKNFSDTLGKALSPILEKRSFFPSFLKERLNNEITKTAYYSSTEQGKDYWRDNNVQGNIFDESKKSTINPMLAGIASLGALYGVLKLKSMGYGPKQLAEIFTGKPWLRTLIGGGVMWKIFDTINKSNENKELFRPASDYSGILQNTNFSGHVKMGGVVEINEIAESIILPPSYINNAINQDSFSRVSNKLLKTSSFENRSKTNRIINEQSIKDINNKISKLLL